jgi:hypothetical protein
MGISVLDLALPKSATQLLRGHRVAWKDVKNGRVCAKLRCGTE